MIKDLKEGFSSVERVFIKNMEEKQGNRGIYTVVYFTDGETEAAANMWSSMEAYPYKGKVVDMKISVRNGYMNIQNMAIAPCEDITPYVPHAPIDPDSWMKAVYEYVEKIRDSELKMVTKKLLDDNQEKFKKWSAAKSVHHNYLNGLLYHVCRMVVSAYRLGGVYNLNTDLLISGAILHDIGKLVELEMDDIGNANYSVMGNLFGHLYIGAQMVDQVCKELGILEDSSNMHLLKHMLLSHHGKQEYGAVVRPATPEAYVLSMVDELDSRLWIYESSMQQLEVGETSNPIHSLDGTVVYRAK